MSRRLVRIGLISDTHGLLRIEAQRALHGSNFIVHAGDICDAAILETLAHIAPVTAVRGNNDTGAWAERLPRVAKLIVNDVKIIVLHNRADLKIAPLDADVRVIVAGHSHRPQIETRDGILFVNPGAAGPRRFRLPVSVGFLRLRGTTVTAELKELETG
jgi:putative phosphoesterase